MSELHFSLKEIQFFVIDQEIYQEILLIVSILDNWVFDSLMLAGELFAKALQRLATCVLVKIYVYVEN